ncbi:MAG: hypothetical protein AAF581_04785 [Planctomycetota bacterium]
MAAVADGMNQRADGYDRRTNVVAGTAPAPTAHDNAGTQGAAQECSEDGSGG